MAYTVLTIYHHYHELPHHRPAVGLITSLYAIVLEMIVEGVFHATNMPPPSTSATFEIITFSADNQHSFQHPIEYLLLDPSTEAVSCIGINYVSPDNYRSSTITRKDTSTSTQRNIILNAIVADCWRSTSDYINHHPNIQVQASV